MLRQKKKGLISLLKELNTANSYSVCTLDDDNKDQEHPNNLDHDDGNCMAAHAIVRGGAGG